MYSAYETCKHVFKKFKRKENPEENDENGENRRNKLGDGDGGCSPCLFHP